MTQQLRTNAWIRLSVFALLGIITLYLGISTATGGGARDPAFERLPMTTTSTVMTLVVTAGLTLALGLAVLRIYRTEVQVPAPGTLRFPGGALGVFGELFLAAVAGVLLLIPIYLILGLPDAAASASQSSAGQSDVGSKLMFALFFAPFGVILMMVRRSVWELRPGQGMVRYRSRWLGRPTAHAAISLYWERWYGGPQHNRVPVAWVLRGSAGKSTFDIVLVDLATPDGERANILHAWQSNLIATARGTLRVGANDLSTLPFAA